jgi:putative ABC transport system substrate-binding protein
MDRRDFVTLLGGAAAWPLTARAQRLAPVRRVGVLMNSAATETEYKTYLAAFVDGLRQLGWNEGQNLLVDVRWNEGDAAHARTPASELLRLSPDVILTGGTANLTALLLQGPAMPIVFTSVSDPVAQGFVSSLSHPGGNLTGFSAYEFSVGSKWLGLLKEVAPALTPAGIVINPEASPQSRFFIQAIEAAAPSLRVETISLPVRTAADIEPVLARFAQEPNGGLIVPTSAFMQARYPLIAELAGQYRLPSIAGVSGFAKEGGLMEYSNTIELIDAYQQAAFYVDRILKGAKPGDLPVQQRTKYTFVVNLKVAKLIGLTAPPTLLAIADEVIE